MLFIGMVGVGVGWLLRAIIPRLSPRAVTSVNTAPYGGGAWRINSPVQVLRLLTHITGNKALPKSIKWEVASHNTLT